jgi:hypothetical protein
MKLPLDAKLAPPVERNEVSRHEDLLKPVPDFESP